MSDKVVAAGLRAWRIVQSERESASHAIRRAGMDVFHYAEEY